MTHITFGTKLEKWDRARVQPLENLRKPWQDWQHEQMKIDFKEGSDRLSIMFDVPNVYKGESSNLELELLKEVYRSQGRVYIQHTPSKRAHLIVNLIKQGE